MDLINRQDVIDAVIKYCTKYDLRELLADIEVLPKQKTGKWIEFPNHMAYKCSECGRIIQTTDGRRNVSKHYPFCHCGARMECEEE